MSALGGAPAGGATMDPVAMVIANSSCEGLASDQSSQRRVTSVRAAEG